MRPPKINDRKLLELIDSQLMNQARAAKELGVSRQAVSQRLRELKNRTTRVIVAKETKQALQQSFDAVQQLHNINEKTISLLDQAESDQDFSLKCVAELRNQIKLAMEIQERIYNQQEAQKFMEIVIQVLKDVSPNAYTKFRDRINDERAFRSSLRIT